jgi:hypothetical protein
MLKSCDIIFIFSYLNQKYSLTDGIYVHLKNAIPTFQYMWSVEGSNLTFKFNSIEQFQNAYTLILDTNSEIEYILYKSNFITFKYTPLYKRVFISTESFSDISYLHTFLNQQGVKEITYSFKNRNN